jgi:hypothetical protein
LSPAVVLERQSKAQAFFRKQNIPMAEQIPEILDCFKVSLGGSLTIVSRDTLRLAGVDYNLQKFMQKFRELFLDPDW